MERICDLNVDIDKIPPRGHDYLFDMEYLCDLDQDAPEYLKKYTPQALPSFDEEDGDTISQEFKANFANPFEFTSLFLPNSDHSFDFEGLF